MPVGAPNSINVFQQTFMNQTLAFAANPPFHQGYGSTTGDTLSPTDPASHWSGVAIITLPTSGALYLGTTGTTGGTQITTVPKIVFNAAGSGLPYNPLNVNGFNDYLTTTAPCVAYMTYVPNNNFVGTDSFQYLGASNGWYDPSGCHQPCFATCTIYVVGEPPANKTLTSNTVGVTGTVTLPSTSQVQSGVTFGVNNSQTGANHSLTGGF